MSDDTPPKPDSLVVPFGTAIGAAMMGFEQALRREPPAEVIAAAHTPERGSIGRDGDLVIRFPEPVVRPGDRLPTTGRPAVSRLLLERGHALEEDPA